VSGLSTKPMSVTPAAFMIESTLATSPYGTPSSAWKSTPFPWRRDATLLNDALNWSSDDIWLSFSQMMLFRSILTTSPLFASMGFARAEGNVRSSPPVIIGAVSMKITSRSIITSIRLTTLISALRCIRSRARRLRILDASFAHEPGDDRSAEAFHHEVEAIQAVGEDVVPEGRGNGHSQRRGRR